MYLSEVDNRIVSLWYAGIAREEIARLLGVSVGKISAVIQQEMRLVGELEVNAMRRLSKAVAKCKLAPQEVQKILPLFNAYKDANSPDPDTLIEVIYHVTRIGKESGITLAQVPSDLERILKSKEEIERGINLLQKARAEIEEKTSQKLRESEQTDESIKEFARTTEYLSNQGLSIDSPKKLMNAILNAEESGYDGKALVERISANRSLEIEKIEREEANEHLIREIKKNEQVISEQQIEIARNTQLLHCIDEYECVAGNPILLKAITNVVRRIAATNGIGVEQANEKFISDVQNSYECFSGFEAAISAAGKKKHDLEKSVEELKLSHAKHLSAIEALGELQDNGVKNSDIVQIKSVFDNAKLDVAMLLDNLTWHGNMLTTKLELERQVENLRRAKLTLEQEVSALERMKGTLEDSTRTIRSHLQNFSRDIEKTCAEISSAGENAKFNIYAIGQLAVQEARALQRSKGIFMFGPLVRSANDEPVELEQLRDALVKAIVLYSIHLPASSDMRFVLKDVVNSLENDISVLCS
ncbi:MAG: hypothetical protein ACREBU_04350 [Nitrososphaera sp.]